MPSSSKRRIEYAIGDRPRYRPTPSEPATVLLRAAARAGCRGRHSAAGSGRGCRLERRGCCVRVEARLWWRRSRGSSVRLETILRSAILVSGIGRIVTNGDAWTTNHSVRFWRWGMGVGALLLVGWSRSAWWDSHGGLIFTTAMPRG